MYDPRFEEPGNARRRGEAEIWLGADTSISYSRGGRNRLLLTWGPDNLTRRDSSSPAIS